MAQNPNPSKLDQNQILQRAFDESEDRLRTDSVATINSGSMEVIISETDDSIVVYGNDGSSNKVIKTNSDGSVSINDNGNSLTVDGSVSATQSGTWNTRLQDGSGNNITSTTNALDINIKSGTISQGTANTTANAWPIKVTDGTNTANISNNSSLSTVTSSGLTVVQSPILPVVKKLVDDYTTTNVIYVGVAAQGTATNSASWQVQKIDQTTGIIITFAGSGGFNQIWDNRTSLTYL